MRRHSLWMLAVGLLVLGGCKPQTTEGTAGTRDVQPAAPTKATVEFGIWTADAAGRMYFIETDAVPNVEDQPYGWRVAVGNSEKPVKWIETITLPEAPDSWEGVDEDPDMRVSADGRTVTTVKETLPEEGYITNYWAVAEGDPTGEYTITVELKDGQKATSVFRVEDVPEEYEEPVESTRI